jgi:hypothetical protein
LPETYRDQLADFFRLLSADIAKTQNASLYSPFLTEDRVAFLMPQLQAAATRVFHPSNHQITQERSKSESSQTRKIEGSSEIGVVVMHKCICMKTSIHG